MKFDKMIGLWKESSKEGDSKEDNSSPTAWRIPPNILETDEEPEPEQEAENCPAFSSAPVLKGSCTLAIRFNNHGEYLKWAKYNPGRTWEFLVSYPAIMRARYSFENAMEVEMMAKKIVQLLTFGFNVYSASWELETNTENEEGNEEE